MRKLVVIGFAVAGLALAPAAVADSSTVLDGYGSNAAKPVVQVKGTTGSSSPTSSSSAPTSSTSSPSSGPSTLPFTGSDLAVFMVAGVVLVGIGFGLRRLGREQS